MEGIIWLWRGISAITRTKPQGPEGGMIAVSEVRRASFMQFGKGSGMWHHLLSCRDLAQAAAFDFLWSGLGHDAGTNASVSSRPLTAARNRANRKRRGGVSQPLPGAHLGGVLGRLS